MSKQVNEESVSALGPVLAMFYIMVWGFGSEQRGGIAKYTNFPCLVHV